MKRKQNMHFFQSTKWNYYLKLPDVCQHILLNSKLNAALGPSSERYRRLCEQAGYTHLPMDHCALNPELCGSGGRCIDTDDSFTCECYKGYKLNADGDLCEGEALQLCIVSHQGNWHFLRIQSKGLKFSLWSTRFPSPDKDECREGACQGGQCYNTQGSFRCHCPVGFDISSDGLSCLGTVWSHSRPL